MRDVSARDAPPPPRSASVVALEAMLLATAGGHDEVALLTRSVFRSGSCRFFFPDQRLLAPHGRMPANFFYRNHADRPFHERVCTLLLLALLTGPWVAPHQTGGPGGTGCSAVLFYKMLISAAVIMDTRVCDQNHLKRAETCTHRRLANASRAPAAAIVCS